MSDPRIIHVPVDAALSSLLAKEAASAHESVEQLAAVLLKNAVAELREDAYFSALSEKREKEATHTIPHDKAWE